MQSMARIGRARLALCQPSTFCLWPAIAAVSSELVMGQLVPAAEQLASNLGGAMAVHGAAAAGLLTVERLRNMSDADVASHLAEYNSTG